MRKDPKLSIITVTYNAKDVLKGTLDSISAQRFNDFELIVIDGGSTDGTLDIIRRNTDLISHYVSEKDNGIYDAMNKGLAMASGEYVTFLNAGDYYCDDKALFDIFNTTKKEKPTVIYGDINILHTDGRKTYLKALDLTLDTLLQYGTGVLCHQAMFVRRTKAPPYDCKYRFKAELNWYFDIVESDGFSAIHIPRPVVDYSLGGFGHKYFISNRKEWIHLVYTRYGLKTIYKSRTIIFILKNSINRYPVLSRPVRFYKRIRNIIKY